MLFQLSLGFFQQRFCRQQHCNAAKDDNVENLKYDLLNIIIWIGVSTRRFYHHPWPAGFCPTFWILESLAWGWPGSKNIYRNVREDVYRYASMIINIHLEYAGEGLERSYEDVHDSKTLALHKASTKRVIQGGANWRRKVIPVQYMSLRVLQWDEEKRCSKDIRRNI